MVEFPHFRHVFTALGITCLHFYIFFYICFYISFIFDIDYVPIIANSRLMKKPFFHIFPENDSMGLNIRKCCHFAIML